MTTRIQPIIVQGTGKSPTTKWEKHPISGEAVQVTTITLTLANISEHDIRRLAQCGVNEIPMEIEFTPSAEQLGFGGD